jgi:hypothetical protein
LICTAVRAPKPIDDLDFAGVLDYIQPIDRDSKAH